MAPVPDFFQLKKRQARLEQVKWLRRELGLPPAFFERVLPNLPSSAAMINDRQLEVVAELWAMALHLLSLVGSDTAAARDFIATRPIETAVEVKEHEWLPWQGRSIGQYLESEGVEGVSEFNRWLTSLRFANRYWSAGLYELDARTVSPLTS